MWQKAVTGFSGFTFSNSNQRKAKMIKRREKDKKTTLGQTKRGCLSWLSLSLPLSRSRGYLFLFQSAVFWGRESASGACALWAWTSNATKRATERRREGECFYRNLEFVFVYRITVAICCRYEEFSFSFRSGRRSSSEQNSGNSKSESEIVIFRQIRKKQMKMSPKCNCS